MLSFCAVIALLLLLATLAYTRVGHMSDDLAVMNKDHYPKTVLAHTIKDELNSIMINMRQIVINALGLKPEAGQPVESLVTLQEVSFVTEPISEQVQAIQAENKWQGWIEAASRWSAVIGAGVVLLVFLRMLSRQKPEPVPVEVLAMPPEMAARSLQIGSAVTPEMLNELIKQKPINIGTALRDWVGTPQAKN